MVAARTAPNRGVRFGGEHDRLDERGRRDAAALADGGFSGPDFSGPDFSGPVLSGPVLSGPEESVTQTASLVAGRYTVESVLASLDVGCWRGLGPEAVDADELAAWFTDPGWHGHGGESVRAFVARIRTAVSLLIAGAADAPTLVVAGPVAQALLCTAAEDFFTVDVVGARRYTADL